MITLDRQEGLWKITLNRPEKANALTAAMLQELAEIAEAAQQARGLSSLVPAGCLVPGAILMK